jgi:serine phosphatase RsbU (regulator of sigma subunit)
MLVFYTDGLIEHDDDPRRGLERLRRSVRWSANDLEVVCDRVIEKMPFENPTDDVALFVVRFD